MSGETADSAELPPTAGTFADAEPDVWDAYSELGRACVAAGPLDFGPGRISRGVGASGPPDTTRAC